MSHLISHAKECGMDLNRLAEDDEGSASYPCETDMKALTDEDLMAAHVRVHSHYELSPTEGVWNCHKLIVEEMAVRHLPHEISDELDDDLEVLNELPSTQEMINNLSVDFVQQWHDIIHNIYSKSRLNRGLLSDIHEKLASQLLTFKLSHDTPLNSQIFQRLTDT